MITLMFTVLALTVFIDKASTDLIVDTRDSNDRRLRQEAYSALEVTLAVLANFREVDGALRSPVEGWSDPLTFASWTPSEGRTVDVSFEDESAKIPLPRADQTTLINLFENWGMLQNDAEKLTDALMNWMKQDYVGGSSFTPDYDSAEIPYAPPMRSLRAFSELSAIDVAKDMFFDENGRPNELYQRFTSAVSLFNYARPNLNSAKPDVLVALANLDATQQQQLTDYQNGTGNFTSQGPAYFRSTGQVTPVLGAATNISGFDVQIRALRIRITVREGTNVYRLTTVVAPPNGAQTVKASATVTGSTASGSTSNPSSSTNNAATGTASTSSGTTGSTGSTTSTSGSSTANSDTSKKLNYPFTVLEIRENDPPPPVPTPPPTA